MQFSLYGSLWVQWCRKRLGCCILDLVDTQKFFISPRPPHSCLDLPCSMVCIFQAVASSCQQCFMKVWVSVLLIFRAVADPRNSAISAKSREIPKKTRNTAKSAGNISKYMSAKHILILFLAIRPVLFTPNVQSYLETSSPQRVNNVPKLPGAFRWTLRKTGH